MDILKKTEKSREHQAVDEQASNKQYGNNNVIESQRCRQSLNPGLKNSQINIAAPLKYSTTESLRLQVLIFLIF